MATTTISRSISSEIADTAEIRAAFAEHKQELTWLAEFLSADELMASACVTDARNLMENNNEDEICQECLRMWAREATIRSVLDFKRMRIAELSSMYEHDDLVGQEHSPMSLQTMEFVVRESDNVRSRLDCLCRFVLVLRGFAQHSANQAALLLGVSTHAVEAAYTSALETLEVISCQAVLEASGWAAA
jgi:DNA-directed RNA polymerase specialized sigma24 family protein